MLDEPVGISMRQRKVAWRKAGLEESLAECGEVAPRGVAAKGYEAVIKPGSGVGRTATRKARTAAAKPAIMRQGAKGGGRRRRQEVRSTVMTALKRQGAHAPCVQLWLCLAKLPFRVSAKDGTCHIGLVK